MVRENTEAEICAMRAKEAALELERQRAQAQFEQFYPLLKWAALAAIFTAICIGAGVVGLVIWWISLRLGWRLL